MNKKIKIALGVILVLIILCCMGSCFLGKAAKSLPKNIKETTNTDSKTIKPTKEKKRKQKKQ
jgi:hypothetical protein